MYAFANRCFFLFFVTTVSLTSAVVLAQEPASEGQQEPVSEGQQEPVSEGQQEPVLETEEILVSTSRLPSAEETIYAVPSKITIITAEDIERSGAKTSQEAIQYSTGIVMYDSIGNAFQQTIDLRGFNGQPVPSTSVFVDGVRVNEPDFNAVNFDLIPLETIERIEILPGTSPLYGKNALGGVINIVTKRGTAERRATGEVMLGSWERQRYNINTSGPAGKVFDYYVNFTHEREDGYRESSDANISRVFGKIGFHPTSDTDLDVSYTYVNDRLLQAGPLTLAEASVDRRQSANPGSFVDHENNFVRLNGRQELMAGWSLNLNGFYRRLAQESFVNFGSGFTSTTNTTTESWGGTVQMTQESTPFGLQNELNFGGEFTRNDVSIAGGSTFSPTMATIDEDILGLYAEDSIRIIPQIVLVAGLRYDHDQYTFTENLATRPSGSLSFSRTNPRAGITYLIRPEQSVYFNFSQGMRVPFPFEAFAFVPFQSNPDLRQVTTDNYELGLKSKLQNWGELTVALFQSDASNEILFTCIVCDGSFGDGINRNVPDTRRRGLEASFMARFNRYFSGTVNYTYTEAELQGDVIFSPTKIARDGDTLPLVPKNRLGFAGKFYPIEGLTLSINGLYVSEQVLLFDESNSFPRLSDYFVLSGRLAYERHVPGGRLGAFLSIINILNSEYSTFGSVNDFTGEISVMPAPTISAYGGINYRFEAFPR